MTAQCTPYACPENLWGLLTTPMATFSKIIWAFCSDADGTARKSVGEFLYRPSIVTFPLCLRVSEIPVLPLLFSSMPLFRCYPTSSPQNFPMSPIGVGGSPFGYKEQRCWLVVRAISFQDFQSMWSLTIHHQRHRQTGRHADRKTALCTKVHCTVKY